MRIQLDKKEKVLWTIVILLILLFHFSSYFSSTLRKTIGIFLIFFVPGLLILFKNNKLEELIAFSPIISVSLIIILTFFLNIWFGVKIDNLFLDKLFLILFSIIFFYRLFMQKNSKLKTKTSKINQWFLLILTISAIFRLMIIYKIGSLIGTDIAKFATISHVMMLKQKITPDLRPYELAQSFFYFPFSFVLSLVIETIGIDSITSISYFSFFFNIIIIVAFYLFASKLLNQKKSLYATFFYSMFFDVSLNYLMGRGVFTFAVSFLPIFLCMYLFLEYFDRKKNIGLLFFTLAFLFFVHWYLTIILLAFLFSLILYEYLKDSSLHKSKMLFIDIIKIVPVIFVSSLPFLWLFGQNFLELYQIEKLADWKMYEIAIENAPIQEKIFALIFKDFATITAGVTYSLGFLVTLLVINQFLKNRKITIVLFFIMLLFSSFFYLNSITWKRAGDYVKVVYPFSFSLIFNHPIFLGLSLIGSPFVENTPIWYLYNVPDKLTEEDKPFYDVVNKEEMKAFDFIKEKTPENSMFLIDSGGAGCVGGQTFSHGERIFPLTSRRVFYFSNSCPLNIDWNEYQKRVDLYRQISINPDDEKALEELKEYGVTHVYIGPYHVGLKPEMFMNSNKYEMVYNNEVYIFEIK
jgi:hypothetical protein